MLKSVALTLAGLILLTPVHDAGRFSSYKTLDAYLVRPQVLMMPRYTQEGRVCSLTLEKLMDTEQGVNVDPSLNRQEIEQVLDEIVPPAERGARTMTNDLMEQDGDVLETLSEYEEVSIRVYSKVMHSSKRKTALLDDVVTHVQWKHRTCAAQ